MNLAKTTSATTPETVLTDENFHGPISPKKASNDYSVIKKVSSDRPSTPATEETHSGNSSPIPFWARSSQSSDHLRVSPTPSSASSHSFVDTLLAESKLTKEDLEKETYYIRYDKQQGLFLNHDSSLKTNYFSKRRETEMVAKKLIESCRNQYGDALAEELAERLQANFGIRYSLITFNDLSPIIETTQFYQKVLQAPLSAEKFSYPNINTSPDYLSLKEHEAVLYKQEGMESAPQPNMVMLPRHYIYSATSEELSAIKLQKTGFIDLQEKQLKKIKESSEEEVLNSLCKSQEWMRVQITINNKFIPSNENGIDLPLFKEEVKTLLHKEPSTYELIQILSMMNKDGRVAGLPKGGSTGKLLLLEKATPPPVDKAERETVRISYDDELGRIVFNYQSQVSKLGSLSVTTPSGNLEYSVRTANNTDQFADLYKMQRTYKATLQLTEKPDNAGDFRERVNLEESRQLFFASENSY